MEAGQLLAFGALALTPQEFYTLTPAELYEMVDGYEWRQERRLEEIALEVAHVVQPHTKKRITPASLLKRWKSKPDKPVTQKAKDFKHLWRKLQLQKKERESKRGRDNCQPPGQTGS